MVVGPEAPLVAGAADAVRDRGIACFGPSAEAARLEGSKAFAKEVMAAAGVPTAMARLCTSVEEVTDALESFGPPFVVKDDGLAAGKGVVVTDDQAAVEHGAACLARPGGRVVVEQYLEGPEVSLFCVTDGGTSCRSRPRRTTSGWGTATPGRTRAGWAPTRRCPGRRRGWRRTSPSGSPDPSSPSWPAVAPPSAGCSTAGSR